MGVSLLNFFDLKPLNTSKWSLNPPFFRDTQYILYIEATNRRLAQWGFTDSILLLICSNHTQDTHTLCSRWQLQFCNCLTTLMCMPCPIGIWPHPLPGTSIHNWRNTQPGIKLILMFRWLRIMGRTWYDILVSTLLSINNTNEPDTGSNCL